MGMEPDPAVLLIISEDDWDEVKRGRDRGKEALFAVDEVVTPEREDDLRRAMDEPAGPYRYVCLVGLPDSPLVTWGLNFFRTSMSRFVEGGGLFTCSLPFRREAARHVSLEGS